MPLSIKIFLIFIILSCNNALAQNPAELRNNDYIKGFIDSLIFQESGIDDAVIKVTDDVIYIKSVIFSTPGEDNILKSKFLNLLQDKKIKRKVVWVDKKDGTETKKNNPNKSYSSNIFLPSSFLFQPLIADPKWPRFTLAYQYHMQNNILRHAFAPNFGASFSLFRYVDLEKESSWDLGIQAGLFAIMDIGSKTSALVNADYYVALPLAYKKGDFSGLIRGYHLSTHLGDEFMLTPAGKKTKRINLSYEGIDILISRTYGQYRLYGGGGYIVHKDPSYVKPGKLQIGSQYISDNTIFGGALRPIAAIDFKIEENSKWHPQLSCKAGVRFENPDKTSHKMMLLGEYYYGKSFHGQFYRDKIHYIGIGLHSFL